MLVGPNLRDSYEVERTAVATAVGRGGSKRQTSADFGRVGSSRNLDSRVSCLVRVCPGQLPSSPSAVVRPQPSRLDYLVSRHCRDVPGPLGRGAWDAMGRLDGTDDIHCACVCALGRALL